MTSALLTALSVRIRPPIRERARERTLNTLKLRNSQVRITGWLVVVMWVVFSLFKYFPLFSSSFFRVPFEKLAEFQTFQRCSSPRESPLLEPECAVTWHNTWRQERPFVPTRRKTRSRALAGLLSELYYTLGNRVVCRLGRATRSPPRTLNCCWDEFSFLCCCCCFVQNSTTRKAVWLSSPLPPPPPAPPPHPPPPPQKWQISARFTLLWTAWSRIRL